MITRREALRRGLGTAAALSALPLLEACAPSGVTPVATATASAAAATAVPLCSPRNVIWPAVHAVGFGVERLLKRSNTPLSCAATASDAR